MEWAGTETSSEIHFILSAQGPEAVPARNARVPSARPSLAQPRGPPSLSGEVWGCAGACPGPVPPPCRRSRKRGARGCPFSRSGRRIPNRVQTQYLTGPPSPLPSFSGRVSFKRAREAGTGTQSPKGFKREWASVYAPRGPSSPRASWSLRLI